MSLRILPMAIGGYRYPKAQLIYRDNGCMVIAEAAKTLTQKTGLLHDNKFMENIRKFCAWHFTLIEPHMVIDMDCETPYCINPLHMRLDGQLLVMNPMFCCFEHARMHNGCNKCAANSLEIMKRMQEDIEAV